MSDLKQKELAIETHSEQAELFADRYNAIQKNHYSNCFVYSRYRLNLWLDRFLPENGTGKRLLDVGCGTGYHLERYRVRGFDVAGMDGSAEMLKQAKIVNPEIQFEQGDVEKLPFPDASFDYVLCIEVLRYLPDIQPCINEIFRVLKPGGTALVTAAPILQANLYPLVNRVTSAMKIGKMTQLKQFFHSSGELRRTFDKAGFTKTDIHGIYGGNLKWIERIMPKAMSPLLKLWEFVDAPTADAPVLRHLSNMFLVHGKK
jgi:ubiquinone/menaquinone biosynthesis C-methylase UbiE